jgi:uncharacterized protein
MPKAPEPGEIVEVTEEDLAFLEAFLMSDRAPEDSMLLSDLDGFLTAIAIGPEPVAPDEWLPLVWNGKPDFASPDEAKRVLGIISARYDEILRVLTQSPEDYAPIFWQDDDGEPIALDWAEGFLDGIRLRAEAWTPLFESKEDSVVITPIAAFWQDEDDEPPADLDPADEAKMLLEAAQLIPTSIVAIFRFWRRRRPVKKKK